MTPPVMGMLGVHAPVLIRVANQHGREFPSRIEDLEADAIIVGSPAGASAALLASGARDVDLSWLSPRGRYEQRCLVIEHLAGGTKQWRLRPLRQPKLIQRRRYVRVTAAVAVRILIDSAEIPGTTIDVSEGGVRVRLPRQAISELCRTTVYGAMGSAQIAVPGYVLRATDVPGGGTEAVIAFEANADDTAAIRRFVLNAQLRARAARNSFTS
jgi:c-di-GMP-binding flagellar brake protein YcgR